MERTAAIPLQGVYRCPGKKCGQLFIANFTDMGAPTRDKFRFRFSAPNRNEPVEFAEQIAKLSPSFVAIYNEAHAAEQYSLMQVCGCGYRKSLEYLIKDYLSSKFPEQQAEIKKKPLSNCIQEMISDPNIKLVAERATWLGNDETHYVRVWETKDLQDLKDVLDSTVHWIAHELKIEKLKISMPAKVKS